VESAPPDSRTRMLRGLSQRVSKEKKGRRNGKSKRQPEMEQHVKGHKGTKSSEKERREKQLEKRVVGVTR